MVPKPQTELDEVSYDPNYRVNWLGKISMFSHVRDNLKQSPCPLQKRGGGGGGRGHEGGVEDGGAEGGVDI